MTKTLKKRLPILKVKLKNHYNVFEVNIVDLMLHFDLVNKKDIGTKVVDISFNYSGGLHGEGRICWGEVRGKKTIRRKFELHANDLLEEFGVVSPVSYGGWYYYDNRVITITWIVAE